MKSSDHNVMRLDRAEWFKSSLATWLVAILIPVLGYAGIGLISQNQEFHAKLGDVVVKLGDVVNINGNRITRLEERMDAILRGQDEIKQKLDDIYKVKFGVPAGP
jgi:hypothetical protein